MTEAKSLPLYSLEELLPEMQKSFASGKGFWIPVTGTSNFPTLSPGRDAVILMPPEPSLKRGDLPLYRRSNGQFVLHRIIRVEKDGSYTCCGDHQWEPEPGIRPEQLVGCVVWIERKGKSFSAHQTGYRLWVRIWMLLLPCRSFLIRVVHACERLKKRFF